MIPRSYIDPAFPAALRALRESRGLSLRVLAARAYVAKSVLCRIENGERRPALDVVNRLEHVLDGDGSLVAMITPAVVAGDGGERIRAAVAKPRALDHRAVTALAEVLAAQRRLDDTMAARTVLPVTGPQWRAVMDLARNARGPAADDLHVVAAEWTQFLGWLHAEARLDAPAVRILTDAVRQADRVGTGPLRAQARNFLGYVARQRGHARGIVRHFEDAYHVEGAATLQRVGDAAQASQGYALMGDKRRALTLLGEATDLATGTHGKPPGTAYWLSPTFGHLNLGLAYLGLGERREAAEHLECGLDGLPAEQRDAEWTLEYTAALSRTVPE